MATKLGRTVSVRQSRESRAKSREPDSPVSPEKRRVVWQLPTHCTHCGSDKLPAIGGAKPLVREIAGEMKGVKHEVVRWQHCACAECGQILTVRSGLA